MGRPVPGRLTTGRYLPILVGHAAPQAWNPAATRARDPRGGALAAARGAGHVPRIRARPDDAGADRVTLPDRPRDALQGPGPARGVRSAQLPLGGRGRGRGATAPAAVRAHRARAPTRPSGPVASKAAGRIPRAWPRGPHDAGARSQAGGPLGAVLHARAARVRSPSAGSTRSAPTSTTTSLTSGPAGRATGASPSASSRAWPAASPPTRHGAASTTRSRARSTIGIVLAPALILLLPLLAMQFTDQVAWGVFDFVFAAVLLMGIGLVYALVRKAGNLAYRAAVGIAIATALFLVWMVGCPRRHRGDGRSRRPDVPRRARRRDRRRHRRALPAGGHGARAAGNGARPGAGRRDRADRRASTKPRSAPSPRSSG